MFSIILDYIPLNGHKLASFANKEGSLKIWCTIFRFARVHQKSQQGTQNVKHQNFQFFKSS